MVRVPLQGKVTDCEEGREGSTTDVIHYRTTRMSRAGKVRWEVL